jgi:hypothetical protein
MNEFARMFARIMAPISLALACLLFALAAYTLIAAIM